MSAPAPEDLVRHVSSTVVVDVTETADLVLSVAAAGAGVREEVLELTLDGAPVGAAEVEELAAPVGTRLHRLPAVRPGRFVAAYRAAVASTTDERTVTSLEEVEYRRPSRYCDSDRLAALTTGHFGGLAGESLVRAVVDWVHAEIAYTPGVSAVTDGALEAYLRRQGVCRDLAQLVITFLRAGGLPARLVSVYAPGLSPADFHAVVEVALDGRWWVVDATGLAPRQALARIATGRDAADTAFLTVDAGRADLVSLEVVAVVDPDLPVDDGRALVRLG